MVGARLETTSEDISDTVKSVDAVIMVLIVEVAVVAGVVVVGVTVLVVSEVKLDRSTVV